MRKSASARSPANSNRTSSLLARSTSLTVGSTLHSTSRPPRCRARRCDATKFPSAADPAKPTPLKVDDHFRAPAVLQMRLVRGAQVLDRRRVEPETVPELGDQDSVDVVGLERGLQHRSPAAGSGMDGHAKTGRLEYRSTRSCGQAGRSSRVAEARRILVKIDSTGPAAARPGGLTDQ